MASRWGVFQQPVKPETPPKKATTTQIEPSKEELPPTVTTTQIKPSKEELPPTVTTARICPDQAHKLDVHGLAKRLKIDPSSLTSNEQGILLKVKDDGACLFRAALFLKTKEPKYLICSKEELLTQDTLKKIKGSIFSAFDEMKKLRLNRPPEYGSLSERNMAVKIWDKFLKDKEFYLYAPSPLIGIFQNGPSENAHLDKLSDSKLNNITASTLGRMLSSDSSRQQEEYLEQFCDIFCEKLLKTFAVSSEALEFEPHLKLENRHYNILYPNDYLKSLNNKVPPDLHDRMLDAAKSNSSSKLENLYTTDPNAFDSTKNNKAQYGVNTTPLRAAISYGNINGAIFLIKKGVDINSGIETHRQKSSPLMMVLSKYSEWRKSSNDPNSKNNIDLIDDKKQPKVTKFQPLFDELIYHPAIDLRVKDLSGNTALHMAAKMGDSNLVKMISKGLSKQGLDVEEMMKEKNKDGFSPQAIMDEHQKGNKGQWGVYSV